MVSLYYSSVLRSKTVLWFIKDGRIQACLMKFGRTINFFVFTVFIYISVTSSVLHHYFFHLYFLLVSVGEREAWDTGSGFSEMYINYTQGGPTGDQVWESPAELIICLRKMSSSDMS